MNTFHNTDDTDDTDDVVMGTAEEQEEEECTAGDGMVARTIIPCDEQTTGVMTLLQPSSHDTDRNADARARVGACTDADTEMTPSGHDESSTEALLWKTTQTHTQTAPPPTSKRRKVSFRAGYATDIFVIPSLTDYDTRCDSDFNNNNNGNNNNGNSNNGNSNNGNNNIRQDLFYSDDDYKRFRANEERRYRKMIAKKLQNMVREKLQPAINEAVARGATLEDVEAMMPGTHEEMMAILNDDGATGNGESLSRALPPAAFAAAFGRGGFGGSASASKAQSASQPTSTSTSTATSTTGTTTPRTIRTTRCSVTAIRTAENENGSGSGSGNGSTEDGLSSRSVLAAAAAAAEQVAREEEGGERGGGEVEPSE